MISMQKITPFLWFEKDAEKAANFYVSVFGKGSRIISKNKLKDTPSGPNTYIIEMELNKIHFTFINGGKNPGYDKFSPSTPFTINCKDQKEVNHYWDKLTSEGRALQCGWLTDKYGVTWQVVPVAMGKYLNGPDAEGRARAMKAMLNMVKLDINKMKKVYEGR